MLLNESNKNYDAFLLALFSNLAFWFSVKQMRQVRK